MPQDPPSTVELAVRVGVLESQVGSLQTNLSSHQNYVAGEFGKIDAKVEAQSRKIAENHVEVKGVLVDLVDKSNTLLARNLKEDGAAEARAETATEIEKHRLGRQPYIVAAISSLLTALAGYLLVVVHH